MTAENGAEPCRRTEDQGKLAIATRTARRSGSGFWNWIERRKIAAHACIALTLWLTLRIVEWAMDLPYELEGKYEGMHIAAMQAGLLTPWGLIQGAMFKFYMELIKANGGEQARPQEVKS